MDKKDLLNEESCIFRDLLNLCTHEKLNKDLRSEDIAYLCDILSIGKINLRLIDTECIDGEYAYDDILYDSKMECEKAISYHYPLGDIRRGEIQIYPLKGYEELPQYIIFANIIFLIVCKVNTYKVLNKSKYYDSQTGVPSLLAVREKMIDLCSDGNFSNYAIMYINIQNFKYINDCGGVACGDAAIIKYTHKLCNLAEDDEAIGRLGGDHYIICVKRENQPKIMAALAGIKISDLPVTGKREFVLSAWVGCMVSEKKELTFDERMQCAVDAYKIAKNYLKQRVVFYNDKFKRKMDWTRTVRELFSKSFDKQKLYPAFQPKVNMKTGELVGFEALCRWNYKGEVIPPIEYIPILDSQGLIHDLDMLMLKETCKCIKNWQKLGIKIPCISVNVSRKNLFIDDIEKRILAITKEVGVDPSCLDIEITESSTEDEFSHLLSFISKMRKNGFKISIDDFGVGYSSLSLLHEIDADIIKFDKSFIDNICSSTKVEYIVESIINYANKTGMTTIAEGVETKDQGQKLMSIGCDYCQGFYYGQAVDFKEATKIMLKPDYKAIEVG